MKRLAFVALALAPAACTDPSVVTDQRNQSELLVGYVSTGGLPVQSLQLLLSSGSWTRTLRGSDFDRHPNNATAFYSGFISIPSGAPLAVRTVFVESSDTLAVADLNFPIEAVHSYRLSFYSTRDLPGYGGDMAIPLARTPPGFPSDSVYYHWTGYSIRPID
jgi:hypothetical protein